MRSIAILTVLYGHCLGQMPPGTVWGMNHLANALFGVELFFVLSGFLIGGILLRVAREGRLGTLAGMWNFWVRRWFRTLPNYYLFLLVGFGLYGLGLWHAPLEPAWLYFLFLQNFATPQNGFFAVSWSLTIEEFFYLLFPITLFFLLRLKTRPRLALLLGMAVFLVVPAVLRYRQLPMAEWLRFDAEIRQVTLMRLDSMMYGVLMVYIKDGHTSLWRLLTRYRHFLLLPYVVFVFCTFYAFPAWFHGSALLQTLFFPIISVCCALWLPFMDNLRTTETTPFHALVTWISKTSYALYLCHMPAIALLNRYVLPVRHDDPTSRHDAYLFVYAGGAFALASLVYVAWEQPWMRLRDRLTTSS